MSSAKTINSSLCAQGQAQAPLLSKSSVTASSLQSSSVVGDNGAGAAEVRSSEDGCASAALIHFIEDYLGIAGLFIGFQSRFGRGSDLILFRAPQTGSTLAVECNVMLERRGRALQVIQEKISANQKLWAT